jgi:hypothetical protein
MSNTQAAPTPSNSMGTGAAQKSQNQSIENFAASLSAGAVVFGIQMAVFLILSGNWKLHKMKKKGGSEKAVERQSLFHKI